MRKDPSIHYSYLKMEEDTCKSRKVIKARKGKEVGFYLYILRETHRFITFCNEMCIDLLHAELKKLNSYWLRI